jgi:membrane complex biogenesis BtpA family protein
VSILGQLSEGKFSIGVIHVPPFPTSLRKNRWDFEDNIKYCVESAKVIQQAGFSSLMIQNVGDEPVHLQASQETIAYMSIIGREVKKAIDIPMGICLLDHDGKAPIAIAKACGADYVRIKTYVGTMVKMTGTLNGCYYEAARYRRDIRAENIDIFADIFDREGYPIGATNLEEMAHFAVYSCMADGLIITGRSTAQTIEMVNSVKKENVSILIGGGVSVQNIGQLSRISNGYIIGTCLKTDPADDFSSISGDKCKEFIDALSIS